MLQGLGKTLEYTWDMENQVNMIKDVETLSLQLQGMEETNKSASILEDQDNIGRKAIWWGSGGPRPRGASRGPFGSGWAGLRKEACGYRHIQRAGRACKMERGRGEEDSVGPSFETPVHNLASPD